MMASDWSTRDHVITVDQSEAPVSRLNSRPFLQRYFGSDWKQGLINLIVPNFAPKNMAQ